jgi:hypothetical protein
MVHTGRVKEKPVHRKTKQSRSETARSQGRPEKDRCRETRKLMHRIVERHRETLDSLADH